MFPKKHLCEIFFAVIIQILFSFPSLSQFTHIQQKTSNLFFIENKGQWDTEVLFLTRIGGLDAWITRKGVVYDFYQLKERANSKQEDVPQGLIHSEKHKEYERYGHVVRVHNVNASVMCKPVGLKKKEGYYNYFIGNDPKKWASFVGLYEEVRVEGIYSGIDQRWYFDENNLRYDYVVKSGADYRQIRLSFEGEYDVFIRDGDLYFTTRFGEIKQAELAVYQIENGNKEYLRTKWIEKDGGIGFEIEDYNPEKEIIIDPLVYSTFIGGSGEERSYSIAIDNNRNAYVTGYTYSSNYPTTSGAYDQSYDRYGDAYVTKLNSNGSSLVYSTFIGGNEADYGSSIAVDNNGNVYLTGYTYSSNFPITSGAYDQTLNGNYDVFVTKLNSNGSNLIYSTYIGGSGSDYGRSIAIDNNGNAYITGETAGGYPTTDGAYDQTHNGYSDVFVTKLNSNGSNLLYSTYVGGSSDDNGYSIAIDASGNAFITGSTWSSNYPTTSGAYDQTFNGSYEAFVTKLNSNGSNLIYSTYIGGSGSDYGLSIVIDNNGNAFVTGYTYSGDYPTTSGAYDQTFNGGYIDVFVTKLNSSGSSLAYSTYIGGLGYDYGYSIAVDNNGNAYVTGETSGGYPTTGGAYDQTDNGNADAFVSKLSSNGNSLLYSTYIGGSDNDYGNSIAIDDDRNVYVTGRTASSNYPTTSGAYDESYNGGSTDVFVTKLSLKCFTATAWANPETPCEGDDLQLNASVQGTSNYSYQWSGPNGFTSTQQNPVIENVTPSNEGTYRVIITDQNTNCSETLYVSVLVYPKPNINASSNSPVCEGDNIELYTTYGGVDLVKGNDTGNGNTKDISDKVLGIGTTYHWTGPNNFESYEQNPVIPNATSANAGTYTLEVTVYGVCVYRYQVNVVVNPNPTLNPTSNSPVCEGSTLQLNANSNGTSLYWTGPNGFTSNQQNPTIPNVSSANAGVYQVIAINDAGCETFGQVNVEVLQRPTATAASNGPICAGNNLQLNATSSIPNSTFSWTGPNGFTSNQQNPTIPNAQSNASGTYTVTVTAPNGCSNTASVSVTVNPLPNPNASYNEPVYVGETIQFNAVAGMESYSWTGPNGFTSNQRNPSIPNAQTSHTGTYTLTVVDNNGCQSTQDIYVEVLEEQVEISVTISPEIRKATYGESLSPAFTSSETKSKYTYRWYKDEDQTPGNGNETQVATTIHLYLSNIDYNDEGYYYLVVSYGNVSATSNYATLIVMSKQPSSYLITSRSRTSITLEWEYPNDGGGEGTLVVVTRPNQYDDNVVPDDGRTYQANSSYGDNSRTIGQNHYVVYNGSGTRVTVTNLARGTFYKFRWFSYRAGSFYNPTYNTTTASNNPRLVNTLYKEGNENYVYGEMMGLSEVYPNPVEGSGIEFELLVSKAGRYDIRIFSILGEEKYHSTYELPEGSNIVSIDVGAVKNLTSGSYILQVRNGSEVVRQQFVVVR